MKEQFFEPGQPDKGSHFKQWIIVFIILSIIFCAVVWHDGYRQCKKEQAPAIECVKNVLGEHDASILMEAIIELQDSQLILQRKYDSLNKKFEQWQYSEIIKASAKWDTIWVKPKQGKAGGK